VFLRQIELLLFVRRWRERLEPHQLDTIVWRSVGTYREDSEQLGISQYFTAKGQLSAS
jgi:hypothetical protein